MIRCKSFDLAGGCKGTRALHPQVTHLRRDLVKAARAAVAGKIAAAIACGPGDIGRASPGAAMAFV
jgi:hypothetical protein